MCIICNVPETAKADAFLSSFEKARVAMANAEARMLDCALAAPDPEVKKRYKAIHKEMVRQRRAWNKLEQAREHAPTAPLA